MDSRVTIKSITSVPLSTACKGEAVYEDVKGCSLTEAGSI